MAAFQDATCCAGIHLPQQIPVLIVGGGPIGLLQALLLSRHGVKSLVIERYPQRLAAPKAHAINPRSLEILRQYGLGEKRVRQLGTSRRDSHWVNFVTSLAGDEVGRLPYERMDPEVLDDTPEMIHNIPQPVLEQELTKLIDNDPYIELYKGFSIHEIKEDDDGITATIEERATGRLLQTAARHLIACDGRRSKVRELLDIESEEEDTDQTMMTIHFSAKLRQVVGERVGMLYWIMDPIAAGFIIGYDLDGTQVHISQVDVTRNPIDSWTEEMCRAKIRDAIGTDIPFDILSFRPWVFRRSIAKTFNRGNVLLAGDAAHSFPPTGGLGLNCGIADAHNLAYKIALVHKGLAQSSIFSSYTAERRGVADIYSRQSVKNGKQIFELLQSLKTAGVDDIVQARKNMMAALSDPAQRVRVMEGIDGQREHFDNLELHIGYVYGSNKPPANASDYTPKFVAGARLPHVWIWIHTANGTQAHGAPHPALPAEPVDVSYVNSWTLIIADDPSVAAAASGIENYCLSIDLPLRVWRLGRDFDVVRQAWFSEDIEDRGGILLRPDQHILTRVATEVDAIEALAGHLGRHV